MYIVDTKSDPKYFIIINTTTDNVFLVSKKVNTLENVKKLIGKNNLERVI